MKIAVLGGGMSGLTLARLLQDKGHECHIFEAEETLGGLCRSKVIDGFVYDFGGGHILHSRNEEVLEYLLNVMGKENWAKKNRQTKIFYKGAYVKYPFENGLNDLPKEDNFECLSGYIEAHYNRKFKPTAVPENFQDWIKYKFGQGIAENFMWPYNTKIWNYNLEQLSTGWIEGRVPSAPVEDVIKASIGIPTEGYKHQSIFYYPEKGGFQTLIDALAEPLENIHLSSPIVSIENTGDKWLVNATYEFDDLISTLPVQEMPKVLKNTPPFVATKLDDLWYNGVLTVFLGLKKEFDHEYSWIYLPHKENGPANRVTFLSHYSEHNAPKGCASVLAEVTYKAKTIPHDRERIIEEVVYYLDKCNIIDKNDVILTDSFFNKYAYPVYSLQYYDFIQIINNFLDEIKLKRFGRFATHSYYNVDHVVENAFQYVNEMY